MSPVVPINQLSGRANKFLHDVKIHINNENVSDVTIGEANKNISVRMKDGVVFNYEDDPLNREARYIIYNLFNY